MWKLRKQGTDKLGGGGGIHSLNKNVDAWKKFTVNSYYLVIAFKGAQSVMILNHNSVHLKLKL